MLTAPSIQLILSNICMFQIQDLSTLISTNVVLEIQRQIFSAAKNTLQSVIFCFFSCQSLHFQNEIFLLWRIFYRALIRLCHLPYLDWALFQLNERSLHFSAHTSENEKWMWSLRICFYLCGFQSLNVNSLNEWSVYCYSGLRSIIHGVYTVP